MTLVASVVGAVILLLLGLLWIFQRQLIYLPGAGRAFPVADPVPGAREVTLETEDGLRLGASYIPARQREGVVVLVTNGNAGERRLRAPLAAALSARGLGVLLFDYRGYGANPGSPTEQGLARDARAARQFLVEEADVPPDRLVYFGESLGCAVATALAVDHPPAAMVLRSRVIEVPGADHNDAALLDGPALIAAVTELAAAIDRDT